MNDYILKLNKYFSHLGSKFCDGQPKPWLWGTGWSHVLIFLQCVKILVVFSKTNYFPLLDQVQIFHGLFYIKWLTNHEKSETDQVAENS